jgi:Heavy metal binding domain
MKYQIKMTNKMERNQKQRDQNSGSMLNQKTNEDFNKQKPNPNGPASGIANQNSEGKGKNKKDTYTCPMHPEVRSDKAGKCSKCGMELVKKKAAK